MSKTRLAPVVTCPAQLFVLDRTTLPDFSGPPDAKGVYLVCVDEGKRVRKRKERVMYVGSSMNIKKRMNDPTHPLNTLREQYNWPTLVYIRTFPCPNYLEREIQFIRLFRPPLNQQHNG